MELELAVAVCSDRSTVLSTLTLLGFLQFTVFLLVVFAQDHGGAHCGAELQLVLSVVTALCEPPLLCTSCWPL